MTSAESKNSMADVYRFLAQSMRYPTTDWFTAEYWSALLSLLAELHFHAEREELLTSRQESSDFIEDIQVEHTRLFINAVPHVIAPPYASVHYRGDGTFYGRIAESTKKFYREKGFSLVREDDLPDHIVYELEFLALLAHEEDEKGEKEFLEKFFTPWFSIFMDKVIEEAHHPYYRVVMKLIVFFTREGL